LRLNDEDRTRLAGLGAATGVEVGGQISPRLRIDVAFDRGELGIDAHALLAHTTRSRRELLGADAGRSLAVHPLDGATDAPSVWTRYK
jgi:hypothetical protein